MFGLRADFIKAISCLAFKDWNPVLSFRAVVNHRRNFTFYSLLLDFKATFTETRYQFRLSSFSLVFKKM